MTIHWMLQTHGNPLGTVQEFLCALWQRAGLQSLIVPVRVPEGRGVVPLLVEKRKQLKETDPFAPLMTVSAAPLVAMAIRETRGAPVGAVLRPCDLRALAERAQREALPLARVLTIGVDCLGAFPSEDTEWRVEKYGVDGMTREALQFARQGGILAYRYRTACQMCASSGAATADVSIGVVGLPARRVMLISARDSATAWRLGLTEITDGEADPTLVAEHDQMRATVARRHEHARQRIMHALATGLPANVEELIAHLTHCAPCQECLDACPTYAGQLDRRNGGASRDAVGRWLATCVGCGLCEDACPKRLPLSAVMGRLSWDVIGEWITA